MFFLVWVSIMTKTSLNIMVPPFISFVHVYIYDCLINKFSPKERAKGKRAGIEERGTEQTLLTLMFLKNLRQCRG